MEPDRQLDLAARAAKTAAQLILQNGGETYRAEETARHICLACGYEADVLAFPTGVMLTIGDQRSLIGRVPRRTVDLSVIDRVNAISRALSGGAMSLVDAADALEALKKDRPERHLARAIFAGGSSAMFAVMFGGRWPDVAIAGACGLITQGVIGRMHDEAGLPVSSLMAGFLTALLALVVTDLFRLGNADLIIVSAMMPFLSGLAVTNAMRDSMRGDMVSGIARGVDAVLRAVVQAAGVGLAIWLKTALGGLL